MKALKRRTRDYLSDSHEHGARLCHKNMSIQAGQSDRNDHAVTPSPFRPVAPSPVRYDGARLCYSKVSGIKWQVTGRKKDKGRRLYRREWEKIAPATMNMVPGSVTNICQSRRCMTFKAITRSFDRRFAPSPLRPFGMMVPGSVTERCQVSGDRYQAERKKDKG